MASIQEPDRSASPEGSMEAGKEEGSDGLNRIVTHEGSSRLKMSLPHEVAFISTVCMAQLLTQANLANALSMLRSIGPTLGTIDPGKLSWFIAGYSLTVGTFILPAGRAGDLFGHRRVFILGFLWFGAWSLVCGFSYFSHNSAFFIFSRVMEGIGPAIVLPCAVAIFGQTYPTGARKAIAFSALGATAPSGAVIGGLFSALILLTQIWAWSFWVNGIVCFVCAALGFFVIPAEVDSWRHSPAAHDKSGREPGLWTTILELDLPAAAVGVAGLVFFNVAWNQAPIDSWKNAVVIVCLIVGLALILCFGYLEVKVVPYPLVSSDMFNVEVVLILGCIGLGWASFGIFVYYGWEFLQVFRQGTPLRVVSQFVPVVVSGLIAGAATGTLITKGVRPGWIMLIAMTAFTLANLLWSITPINQTYWALSFVAVAIAPFGMDMSFPAANLVISDYVPRHRQGAAASLVNTVLNYSISIGLGIAGTTEVHLNRGGQDPLRGFRAAFRVGTGLAGLGMILSIALVYLTRHNGPAHKAA